MPSLDIIGHHTSSQNGQATFFDPYGDALSMVMTLRASADLLQIENPRWKASFQIIEPKTNAVVVHQSWSEEFIWGANFWISLGNNWSPGNYDTPHSWGLNWTPLSSEAVFGFRGMVKAYSWQGESGLISVDAFDVSDIHWFRVREVYSL